MTTYAEFRSRIRRGLGDSDTGGTPQYSDALIHDAILMAHIGILPWVGKSKSQTLSTDGETTEFALPTDCYQVLAVHENSNDEFLPTATLASGEYFGTNITGTNSWLEHPYENLTFAKAPSSSATYTVYYIAYWTVPAQVATDTVLEIPEYAEYGLLLFAMAQTLIQKATLSADVRQWGTRVDSGTPEHNPIQRQIDFLFKLFQQEMNKHPKTQAGHR